MCKIMNISEYTRNQQLKADYLDEVNYYVNKLVINSRRYHKIENMLICPCRKLLLNKLSLAIQDNKTCIATFTRLYTDCNTQLVQAN